MISNPTSTGKGCAQEGSESAIVSAPLHHALPAPFAMPPQPARFDATVAIQPLDRRSVRLRRD